VKRFEAILGTKQPDLLNYCIELSSSRDCLQAIRSIRDCKHHIQLAETIIANRYAVLLAERSSDSENGGKKSSAVVPFGAVPFAAPPPSHGNSAAAAATSLSVRFEIFPVSNPSFDHFRAGSVCVHCVGTSATLCISMRLRATDKHVLDWSGHCMTQRSTRRQTVPCLTVMWA